MISAEGRWGGAVTSRALPDVDGEVTEIAPAMREHLARIWLSQAATEARVAQSFALVHESLVELGADAGLVAVSKRAIDDEHRHTMLCREMARRYLGAEVTATPELPFSPPRHEAAASDEVRRALWVIGQCAFNETFASAYLSLCHERAEVAVARAALRELLSDEIDHARIGWAWLSTLPSKLRPSVDDWLLPLAVCNLREWRSVRLAEDASLVRHGIPCAADVEEALVDALRDLIVPGLVHTGCDTRAIERWIVGGAAT